MKELELKKSGIRIEGKRLGEDFIGYTSLLEQNMYVSIAFKNGGVTHCPIEECEEIKINIDKSHALSAISQCFVEHNKKMNIILEDLSLGIITSENADTKIRELNKGIILPY